MNPYETLGVKPTASAADIRSAFRRKAREAHPDRDGGSDAAMAAVNEAKAILLDPMRRLSYDATGDGSADEPVSEQAMDFLVATFQQLIDDDTVNIIAEVARRIEIQRAKAQAQVPILRRRRVKLEKRRAKVRVKAGVNLVHSLIDDQLRVIEAGIRACDTMVEIMASAKQQLTAYECDEIVEPVRQDMSDAIGLAFSVLNGARRQPGRHQV